MFKFTDHVLNGTPPLVASINAVYRYFYIEKLVKYSCYSSSSCKWYMFFSFFISVMSLLSRAVSLGDTRWFPQIKIHRKVTLATAGRIIRKTVFDD